MNNKNQSLMSLTRKQSSQATMVEKNQTVDKIALLECGHVKLGDSSVKSSTPADLPNLGPVKPDLRTGDQWGMANPHWKVNDIKGPPPECAL